MAKTWPAVKDPDERKDYSFDWEPELIQVDDILAASAWSVVNADSVLQIDSDSFTDTVAIVWLSGGVVGTNYYLLNRVTTRDGRTYDQTIKLRCRAK